MIDLSKFSEDPYAYVDNLNLTFKGHNLNLFQKYKKIQRMALWGSLISLFCWILFGFDSTPLQFLRVIYEQPNYFMGEISFSYLGNVYQEYYGKEMHYSAFVIYWGLFYFLSLSWEKAGVTKSKNIVFSSAGMLLSVAVFEWFWILSFASFQNQPWVATWRFPQMRILLQNLVFSVAGGITIPFLLTERYYWGSSIIHNVFGFKIKGKEQLGRSYFFRARSWKLWILVAASILAALFWIYYPFHVDLLTVELETGEIWRSSRLFPQTLYTVDLSPGDGVNAGVWFWIENDLIHAVNTGVKFLWALCTYYVFRVRRAE